MPVLIWGLIFVAAGFLIHVALWRVRPPKRHTRALVLIFLSVLVSGTLGLSMLHGQFYWPYAPIQYLHIALFVIVFSASYIITYSAVEVDSPSLLIIAALWRAGPLGMPASELEQWLSDDLLVKPRLKDMVRDHLATIENDRYFLSSKGRASIRIFIFFRRLLNMSKGG